MIDVDAARRIALAAQGFAQPRPSGPVGPRHLRQVIDRIGVLQLDSVNVVCRSHYLPVFARLGTYPRATLDRMAWGGGGRRALFEYWAHQASMLPLAVYPLLRWRMRAARAHTWGRDLSAWRSADPALNLVPWAVVAGMTRLTAERPGLVEEVLAVVAERGPIVAGDIDLDGRRRGGPHPDPTTGRMWNWQDAKIAVEWLFYTGRVATATRRGFERLYDLAERVIPADVLSAPAPAADDARRELIRAAARALGIATEKELAAYFGLDGAGARVQIAELVDAGELVVVRVGGRRMYLWARALQPDHVGARALLSPFDSLIWDRDRVLRLFGFQYRISIYTPEPQRTHGYYVLPFLLGDRLVARVDLKADRAESALRVPVVTAEPGVDEREVVAELAAELRSMADWLELDRVLVGDRGDLAHALARVVGRPSPRGG